ncbi:MAG TPA: hypothetical protein VN364_12600 [Bellilinea sp.]|nr:hypothetical protein [Bellilinea sp.]
MNRTLSIALFVLGACLAALAALGQPVPGYMDAEYYYGGALRLVNGDGFSEPYLWNYLDDPAGLPHPSHLYWMPLASILGAVGMKVLDSTSFWAARLPFILLYGLLPVISAQLSLKFLRNLSYAWIAGLLAAFSGVYIVYSSIPETFVLYLVLGGLTWLLLFQDNWEVVSVRKMAVRAGLLGLLAGLMHLSRADGLVWAAGGIFWIIWISGSSKRAQKLRVAIVGVAVFLLAYTIVMGAWYARNLNLFGTLMAAGNSRTLWLTNYDQTFSFPANQLTFARWQAAGIGSHLQARWDALVMNLKNLVAVQGLVILVPLMIAGLWQKRGMRVIQFAGLMMLGTLALMTLVFPYAGSRGGYLHSAAAFQTLLWAATPAGLELFVAWGQRKRNWQPERATPVFASLLVLVCMLMTGWFYLQKVVGTGAAATRWGYSDQVYHEVDKDLENFAVTAEDLIMVNNPPGFYLATGRPAIVIPGGGVEQAVAAAKNYGAKWMLLGAEQGNLAELYQQPEQSVGLQFRGNIGELKLFCFNCE